MEPLPVYAIRERLVAALRAGNRVVVQAPTGSGKSTQIPQILLDAAFTARGRIVVLQPRRLAARLLARRVAAERGTSLGDEVGYHTRLERRVSAATRICFETDGILLRRLMGDPLLRDTAAILFDEFHERHLYGDVALMRALALQQTSRPDLKVVVMSATLEAQRVQAYLGGCELLEAHGRTYPVEVAYLQRMPRPEREPVWETAANAFETLAESQPGDALIFMPGAYEIDRTVEAVKRTRAGLDCVALPLHGELSPDAQDRAVSPQAGRKVVVATNVAETSLTIDGIRLVIDSGLARKAGFDPHRGINTLLIEKISRASSEQRAGRAGRTAPGFCMRLWTEQDHAIRPAAETPEVRRVDLAEAILMLKAAGVHDVGALPWLDAPEPAALARANTLLTDLGALDADGALTAIGERLPAFPTHPRYARLLVAAEAADCVYTAALAVALMQERSILLRARNRDVEERRERRLGDCSVSDLLQLVRAREFAEACGYDVASCESLGIHAGGARRVGQLHRQFLAIAAGAGMDTRPREAPPEALQRCVLAAFADQLGRRGAGTRCVLVHGRAGVIDKESVVTDAGLVVAAEIHEIGRQAGVVEVRLSMVTAVEEAWLRDMYPDAWRTERRVYLDRATKRVRADMQVRFRDLVLRTESASDPAPEEAAGLLAEQVLAGAMVLKRWNHSVDQWIARVNLVAATFPDYEIPAYDEDARRHIVTHVCLGAYSQKEIKERDVWPAVRGWLSAAQRATVEHLAPERVTLSNGRTPKVTYAVGGPPTIALRIQELYGVEERITIADGRVRVVVQVLAPNQRPIQITDNLASFWKNGYPLAKKELRGRYPKHEWL